MLSVVVRAGAARVAYGTCAEERDRRDGCCKEVVHLLCSICAGLRCVPHWL